MIVSTTNMVRKADFYLNEPVREVAADVIRYFYWESPVPGCHVRQMHSAVTNLEQDAEAIFAHMKKETRRLVRYAEKECADRYRQWNGDLETLDMICDLHDRFAAYKGLARSDRTFLHTAARAGLLEASWVLDADGEPSAWRVYYQAKPRIRPIRGGSRYFSKENSGGRQAVGRATRYLVWRDMLRFRDAGFTLYDQGGWYVGPDRALNKVNDFKEEFGVQVVERYDCIRAATWRGRLALWFLDLRNAREIARFRAAGLVEAA